MANRVSCAPRFSRLLVAVAVSRPGAPVPLLLGALGFCFVFLPFSGDFPRNDHFRLATVGVTFLLPNGKGAESEAVGTDPRTGVFRYPFMLWHCLELLLTRSQRLQTTILTDLGSAILTLTCCHNVMCYGPVYLFCPAPTCVCADGQAEMRILVSSFQR